MFEFITIIDLRAELLLLNQRPVFKLLRRHEISFTVVMNGA